MKNGFDYLSKSSSIKDKGCKGRLCNLPRESRDRRKMTVTFNVVTVDSSGEVKQVNSEQNEYRYVRWQGHTIELRKIPEVEEFPIGVSEDLIEEEKEKGNLIGHRITEISPTYPIHIRSFWMGVHPITQTQWESIAKPKPVNNYIGSLKINRFNDYPVENVSWLEAMEFCKSLSIETGYNFRLPSEAEWEYACRARTRTPFHFGEKLNPNLANYDPLPCKSEKESMEKSNGTVPVNKFQWANYFGLYNMHGNVWEWCQDIYHFNYEGIPDDGSPWIKGSDEINRVMRGGYWGNQECHCLSSTRGSAKKHEKKEGYGFRIVCSNL
jgi:formylglycine-generating enzyme required for sulfatase activity